MKTTISKYIAEVFRRNLHYIRSWRLQAFAIKPEPLTDPYYPVPTKDGVGFYDEHGELIELEGLGKVDKLSPLLPTYTEFTLDSADMLILKKSCKTLIGTAMLNYMIFTEFHPRYPYINGIIDKTMLTDPFLTDINAEINDDEYNEAFIRVMSDIATMMASDSEFILRSIVEGQFSHDKEREKLRDMLNEKHKDELTDPLVVAGIQGKLTKASKQHYKDIGANIWTSDKAHAVTVYKAEGNYGSETSIDGSKSTFIIKSLKEGIEIDKIGVHIGVTRFSSFGRGRLTAEGGAAVNAAYRATQSRQCTIDDCGTKRGAIKRIRDHNYKLFIGQALAGTNKYLTEINLKNYIGRTISIRVSSKCMASPDNVCKLCGGRDIARIPDSIPTKTAGFMSTLMGVSMAGSKGLMAQTTFVDFMDDIF